MSHDKGGMRITLPILLFMLASGLNAQISNPGMVNVYDSLEEGKVLVGAYVDAYYAYDFSQPLNSDRLYAVSSARHHEFTINLAYADFKYINDRVRAHFVPGFGSYMNANYAAETGAFRYIVEANAGVKLFKNKAVWVDAGILPSPYTNESAISKDHLMYTRSIAPEYVPYYLSGVKLTLPLGKKLTSYAYIINGWQQIQDQNKSLAFGTQLEFRPGKRWLFNWDTYSGNERSALNPDFGMRHFTDLYMIYNPDGKFSMSSCIYAGRQIFKNMNSMRPLGEWDEKQWWQANVIGRYAFSRKTALSGRIEYFEDASSVMITPVTGVAGFSSFSGGLCLNIKVGQNALFRLEGRSFYSEKKVYLDDTKNPSKSSHLLISNLSVWF